MHISRAWPYPAGGNVVFTHRNAASKWVYTSAVCNICSILKFQGRRLCMITYDMCNFGALWCVEDCHPQSHNWLIAQSIKMFQIFNFLLVPSLVSNLLSHIRRSISCSRPPARDFFFFKRTIMEIQIIFAMMRLGRPLIQHWQNWTNKKCFGSSKACVV